MGRGCGGVGMCGRKGWCVLGGVGMHSKRGMEIKVCGEWRSSSHNTAPITSHTHHPPIYQHR